MSRCVRPIFFLGFMLSITGDRDAEGTEGTKGAEFLEDSEGVGPDFLRLFLPSRRLRLEAAQRRFSLRGRERGIIAVRLTLESAFRPRFRYYRAPLELCSTQKGGPTESQVRMKLGVKCGLRQLTYIGSFLQKYDK